MAEHRGGKGNFAEDPQRASEAGRKGGQHSGGNFKNDPARASEAGRKEASAAALITDRQRVVSGARRHDESTLLSSTKTAPRDGRRFRWPPSVRRDPGH